MASMFEKFRFTRPYRNQTSGILKLSFDDRLNKTKSTYEKSKMTLSHKCQPNRDYIHAITDLNRLQYRKVNSVRYEVPDMILPVFRRYLERAEIRLEQLNQLNVIHVGGTKGKGSTCVFIESILRQHGFKTGFYNSPHVKEVNERIKINGQPIDNQKFTENFYEVFDRINTNIDAVGRPVALPTYFEMLTIMAFHVFLKEKVNYAIVEVGVGGEFDPTNVIEKPVACGITTLDYDHTKILGDTIQSISRTKSRICKPGVPLFTVCQPQKNSLDIIHEQARRVNSPLVVCQPFENTNICKLGIDGAAQLSNAALACQICNYLLKPKSGFGLVVRNHDTPFIETPSIDFSSLPDMYKEGLGRANLIGRCQTIKIDDRLTFYIDGAHTPKSMENCLSWFKSKCKVNSKKLVLINIIGDRNRQVILEPLTKYAGFDTIIFTSNNIQPSITPNISTDKFSARAEQASTNIEHNIASWYSVSKHSDQRCISFSTIFETFDHISKDMSENQDKRFDILATGSLHFAGAILQSIEVLKFKHHRNLSASTN